MSGRITSRHGLCLKPALSRSACGAVEPAQITMHPLLGQRGDPALERTSSGRVHHGTCLEADDHGADAPAHAREPAHRRCAAPKKSGPAIS